MHSSKPEENELPYWNAVLLFSIGIEVSRHNPKPTILVINSKPIIKIASLIKFFFLLLATTTNNYCETIIISG